MPGPHPTHARPPADSDDPSGWLLRAFPTASQTDIVLRAVTYTVLILGLEYVIEVVLLDLPYWQRFASFLDDPAVPLSALGLVFTLVLLGQWGQRYIDLWTTVRPAFDVSDEDYTERVTWNLTGLYDRDHVPFVLFVIVQLGIYAGLGSELPAGFFHIGFLHFFAVMAIYSFYRHSIIVSRLGTLDLVDVSRARPILAEIADFSVVVCLNWFAALALLVVYVGFYLGLDRDIGLFYAGTVVVLVGIGLLVFVVPLVLLHEALARAKHERLIAITGAYEALYAGWQADDLDGDPAVGLDILDTRLQNARSLSTWPYRLVSVGKLLVGSLIPTALSIVQALGL